MDEGKFLFKCYFDSLLLSPLNRELEQKFAEKAEMTMEAASNWLIVNDISGETKPNDQLIKRFLMYIYEGVASNEDGFTTNLWDTSLKACQWFLDKQLTMKELKKSGTGYVKSLPGITECDKLCIKKRQNMENDGGGNVDIQENLNSVVSSVDMIQGMKQLYSFDRFPELEISSDFLRLTLMTQLRHAVACASRGEDLRYEVLASMFTSTLRTLGPRESGGVEALCYIANCGKVNRSGRKTTHGFIPHMNALLCGVALIGFLLIYRWQIAKEDHPDFTDYTTLFGCHLYRSPTDMSKSVSYETMRNIFTAFFKFLKCVVNAVTHYPRHEAYQEMDANGVRAEDVDRLANRVKDAKSNSYALNLPVPSVAERGGRRLDDLNGPGPAHMQALPLVTSEHLNELTQGWILEEMRKVEEALETAARSASPSTQMRKFKLFAAKGSLAAVVFALKVCILAAAARPRDEFGHIVTESEPLFKKFPGFPPFQLPFFKSASFMILVRSVRQHEDNEIQGTPTANITPVVTRVREAVEPLRTAVSNGFLGFKLDLEAERAARQESDKKNASLEGMIRFHFSGAPLSHGDGHVHTTVQGQSGVQDSSVLPESSQEEEEAQARGYLCPLDFSKGHLPVKPLSSHVDIASICTDYITGINGTQSVKSLEAGGKKWRGWKGGAQRFNEYAVIYRLLDRQAEALGSYDEATKSLHKLVTEQFPPRGKSRSHNWKAAIKYLREQEKLEYGEHLPKRIKRGMGLPSRPPQVEDEVFIDFHRDGSVIEAPEVDPRLHDAVAGFMGL